MFRKKFIAITALVFLILVSACNLPWGPAVVSGTNQDPTAAIQTQVAEIVASTAAVQTAFANAVASTLAAMATNTPEFTFTPSLTPTPTFTLTPTVPMVSVSVQTNCRSGPGKAYDVLGVLNVGQTAEVVGQVAGAGSWIIRLPSNPAITCWIWTQYAAVVGNTAGLPVFNPPPTPTPAATFVVTYLRSITCAPKYAFRFNITNNGSITWQSIQIVLTDNSFATTTTHTLDNFRSYDGCVLELDQQDLTPGETGPVTNVNPGQIVYDPAGHIFSAVFRLCSENGLAGLCMEKTITFTP